MQMFEHSQTDKDTDDHKHSYLHNIHCQNGNCLSTDRDFDLLSLCNARSIKNPYASVWNLQWAGGARDE